jgi:hypothetical protein
MSDRRLRPARLLSTVTGALALALATAGVAQADQPGVTATFSITKQAEPADTAATFRFTWEDLTNPSERGEFELKAGETKHFPVGRGQYRVTEVAQDGWVVGAITCTTDDDEPPVTDVAGGRVDIELSPDEQKACTFTNTAVQPPSPPTPPTPPTPPVPVTPEQPTTPEGGSTPAQPQVEVLRRTNRRGVARLQKPSGCVVNRYTVAVRGSAVRRVTFVVNRRRVRSIAARGGQRRFVLTLKAPPAIALVEARVTFASNAQPRRKTLRTTIRRCARAAASPQFTG